MNGSNDRGWNPYLAGGLSGVVAVLSVWLAGKFFGASTTFVRTAGMIEKWFMPDRVAQMEYFQKELPVMDWQWMFVAGILIGSLIASLASKSFTSTPVPPMWESRFGAGRIKRWLVAFAGGVIAMFGARLADGCPSGHGLSGVMQLSVSGLVALACFFTGGFIVARLLYRGGAR